jgi:hypothetical protein
VNAEYECAGRTTRFTVALEQRADGSMGPPITVVLSARSCCSKKPTTFYLGLVRIDGDLAVYQVL